MTNQRGRWTRLPLAPAWTLDPVPPAPAWTLDPMPLARGLTVVNAFRARELAAAHVCMCPERDALWVPGRFRNLPRRDLSCAED